MRCKISRASVLLVASTVFLLLMVLFSVTPIIWRLSGSPRESYPELFFAMYGIPLGLLFAAAAAVNFLVKRRRRPGGPKNTR